LYRFINANMSVNKPYIIGITGGSGSGKTTFLKEIMKGFSKKQICVISQDDYYRPREEQELDSKGIKNFDRPNSIDSDRLVADLKRLINGETIELLEYTFNNSDKEPAKLEFKPAPILIIEGLFIFHYPKVAELLELKLFVEAKETLKVIRRIKRDRLERNYPLDDVLYRYEKHVSPAYDKYILPYKGDADIIINNNNSFNSGVDVVKGFIQSKLNSNL